MGAFFQDLRFSLRLFRRNPWFTATALAALALGMGANTAIFSVVNAVLLRPLPYPHPERIVRILGRARWGTYPYTSVPRFNAYRALSAVFEDVAAYDWNGGAPVTLGGGDRPEQVVGEHVSYEYFRLFGVPFSAGRGFTPDEDRPGGGRVAVLSSRRFGADPALLGKPVVLGGDSYTVVGIAGPDFAPDPPVDVWLPLQADPASTNEAHFLFAAARLRPGVTLDQAGASLELAARGFRRRFPNAIAASGGFTAEPLQRSLTADRRPALLVLLGAVACVLLIACANLANLLLASGIGRAREMAIRAATGAGRARIVRQLLTESLVLSLAGAAIGLAVGAAGVRALLALDSGGLAHYGAAVTPDARVLAFALVLSLATAVWFGLFPALHAARVNLEVALKEGGPRTGARGQHRARSAIVVAEVAAAFVLLTGAGLLLRSFAALRNVDPGFDPRHVLTMESALDGARFASTAAVASAVRRAEESVMSIPGVEAVAAAPSAPLESGIGMAFRIAGRPLGERPFHGSGWWRYVTPGYFAVYRIPILRGRAFTARDDAATAPVVLINATMARKYWPGGDPIGQRILLDNGDPRSGEPYREIVGVVADVRELGLQQESGSATYVPLAQVTDGTLAMVRRIGPLTWAVRAKAAPFSVAAEVQRRIRGAAGLSAERLRAMDQVVSQSTARNRFQTLLLAIFAAVSILLASIGLYGVIAFSIRQRTREFGIRLALGADQLHLRRLIAGQALALTLGGILAGLVASLTVTRLLAGMLFGVQPNDPLTLASAALLLILVALLGSLLPAWRTGRIDPAAALRGE